MRILLILAPTLGVTVPPPSPDKLPGSTELSNLVAGVEYLALLILVGAMAWNATTWAVGHQAGNAWHVQSGKEGLLKAVGGAILVGAASGLVNYFWGIGLLIK